MAIKPDDGDTFVREVDEELRKERLNTFVSRYGWWIAGAIVLLLGAVGGYLWWAERQTAEAGARAEQLVNALDMMESGNRNGAATVINELAASDSDGYRAAALFARATRTKTRSELRPGGVPAAGSSAGELAGRPRRCTPPRAEFDLRGNTARRTANPSPRNR